ncbi:RAMP superfamily CRISPR-associated protein [Thiothrix eikelboomii]|uniref:RAMP superfamily CRISPR-associated protein n=1 Tax=Thiothrix eikelboomii TaxID=92487 RepID=UPI003BAEDE39
MFERIRISGTLRLCSDLHVGSGNVEDIRPRVQDAEEGSYRSVLLDHAGKPMIPASTLRGWLRQYACTVARGSNHTQLEYFEYNAFGHSEGDKRVTGRVRLQDAILRAAAKPSTDKPKSYDAERGTLLRHGIALDARTGVVDDHKLFHYEVVPAGTVFSFSLEVDRCDPEELPLLLGLLTGWDGSQNASVGGDSSMGQGRLQWTLEKVESVTAESISSWLARQQAEYWQVMKTIPDVAPFSLAVHGLSFGLDAFGGLLINDPDWVKDSVNEQDHPPKQVYSRRLGGEARIPGRSLRGLVRTRARRIVATLLHQAGTPAESASEQAEALITPFFGGEKQAGCLFLSDALLVRQQVSSVRPSIAVDRFTGGVKGCSKGADDGALWAAEVIEQAEWKGDAQLDAFRLPDADWWKGLLLFVVRDALEGDFAIGSGKSKGLGQFRLKLYLPDQACIGDWAALRDYLQSRGHDAAGWVKSLHDYLQQSTATTAETEEAVQ